MVKKGKRWQDVKLGIARSANCGPSQANVRYRCALAGRKTWRNIDRMEKVTVDKEVSAYLLWFEHLAGAISKRQGVVSRPYRCDAFTAYSRYSI